MLLPKDVQIIGSEIAFLWEDGSETYLTPGKLRAASPSAETRGERDIFGKQHGGTTAEGFEGVLVLGWERVGNYALRFDFSDGHRTGLFTFDYLRNLASKK
jgi:DUF971 family protein